MDPFNPISSEPPRVNESTSAEEEKKDERKRQERSAAFKKSLDRGATSPPPPPVPAPPRAPASAARSTPKAPQPQAEKTADGPSIKTAAAPLTGQAPAPATSGPASAPAPRIPVSTGAPLSYQPNLSHLTPAQLSLLSAGSRPRGAAAGPAGPVAPTPPLAAQSQASGDRLPSDLTGIPAIPVADAQGPAPAHLDPDSPLHESLRAQLPVDPKSKDPKVESKAAGDSEGEPPASAAAPGAAPLPPPMTEASGPMSRVAMPPEIVQQLVEFAAVHTNQSGTIEFHLGLAQNILGGLRIQLSAYGNRRVGISVRGGKGGAAIPEAELADLIESLRKKDIEVVEVDVA